MARERLPRASLGGKVYSEEDAFLQSDAPSSLRDMAIMMGDREHYSSWGNILHAVKTGDKGRPQSCLSSGKINFISHCSNPKGRGAGENYSWNLDTEC